MAATASAALSTDIKSVQPVSSENVAFVISPVTFLRQFGLPVTLQHVANLATFGFWTRNVFVFVYRVLNRGRPDFSFALCLKRFGLRGVIAAADNCLPGSCLSNLSVRALLLADPFANHRHDMGAYLCDFK